MSTTIPLGGLSTEEAKKRLREQPPHKQQHTKTTLSIVWSNVFSPFTLINFLLIATLVGLYFYWNDTKLLLDCVGIVLVVFANTTIAIVQEIRARSIVEKARLLQQHIFTVIRDGKQQQIPAQEVVVGDIVQIQRGEGIPIDGIVRYSTGLEIDESLITGESDVITKSFNDTITSGSICVAGVGFVECTTSHNDSYAQKLTQIAQSYSVTTTPLQRKINLIFELSFVIALLIVAVEIVVHFVSQQPFTIDFVRRTATVVLTLIPEGIVFFSTVTFAIAVVKAQKLGVIIQKLSSIESLAGIDVLCFDKTGTLTEANVTFTEANSVNEHPTLPVEIIREYAYHSTEKSSLIVALLHDNYKPKYTKINEIPFSSERKYSALELRDSEGNTQTIYVGAIEVLAPFCNDKTVFDALSNTPKRSLLLCLSPNSINNQETPANLIPEYILHFEEQIKYDVIPTLDLCKKMGIKTVVISGDSAQYIQSIVERLHIHTDLPVVEGTSIELTDSIPNSTVYARMKPDQKATVIQNFQKNGRVAMVGDGVNDVPAMKQADLSIAMNAGSSITREISDIILQNNSFETVPKLFAMGRNIIATCLVLTQLYLVKNFIVVFFDVFSFLLTIPFPFTPRRSGLLGLLTTAIPAYFFSVYNKSETTTKEFFVRIWSILLPASIIGSAGGFAVGVYGQLYLHASNEQLSMLILAVLVFTMTFLFQFLASFQNHTSKKSLLLSAILITFFGTLIFTPKGIWGLTLLQSFYEITVLPFLFLPVIAITSVGISLLIFGVIRITLSIQKQTISLNY
ncbi:MAG: HAD-IC family P-type ATPase [Candidatus Kapabacteria bacterium]|nr:HAD-IC family P-type ATPase [Candidatus Kapabacteria bacterium]